MVGHAAGDVIDYMDSPFLDSFYLLCLSAVDEVMPDRCSVFKDWAEYCGIEMEKLVLWGSSSLKLF